MEGAINEHKKTHASECELRLDAALKSLHDTFEAATDLQAEWIERRLNAKLKVAVAAESKNLQLARLSRKTSNADRVKYLFAEVGNTPLRQQLDVGDVNGSSSFWRDVVVENNTNRSDYNGLLSANARFAAIDPSTIVIHDIATMYDMWKTVNREYLKALAMFTKSGEQEEDFLALLWRIYRRFLSSRVLAGKT
ncbi:hypothetical protein PHMEG_00018794 [Phytophthora megakarya]|uniref:Uncharacterized protein n=1 Tax=Phytophthora megakarya TaxID=4795 RepID=A0A225VVR5_9STRA|nr:hypothetical protein PHMEG_00018794 [Phytophthora megakarya]